MYLGLMFTTEGKIEHEMDRWSVLSHNASVVQEWCGEEGTLSEGKTLDLPVNLYSNPDLWP